MEKAIIKRKKIQHQNDKIATVSAAAKPTTTKENDDNTTTVVAKYETSYNPNMRKRRRRGKEIFILSFIILSIILLFNNHYSNNNKEQEIMRQRKSKNQVKLRTKLRFPNKIYQPHGSKNLTAIRILGERHSGTNWLTDIILTCFPTINVHNALLNNKHWFQHDFEHIQNLNKNPSFASLKSPPKGLQFPWDSITSNEVFSQTYVISIFRNPYDWIDAMRKLPHHWPNHFNYKIVKSNKNYNNNNSHRSRRRKGKKWKVDVDILPWKEFIQRNMTIIDDDEEGEERETKESLSYCQKGYLYGAISPCRHTRKYIPKDIIKEAKLKSIDIMEIQNLGYLPGEVHDPVYEHSFSSSPSEENNYIDIKESHPYNHPLELRADKIRNLMNLSTQWKLGGFLPIRYEDMVTTTTGANGIRNILIDPISEAFEVEPSSKCNFDANILLKPDTPPKNQQHDNNIMDKEWEDWITNHADWDTEAKVGYEPRFS